MYLVYVLYSHKDKKLYVGYTKNIDKRYNVHLQGLVASAEIDYLSNLYIMNRIRTKGMQLSGNIFLKSGRGREFVKSLLRYSLPG